MTRIIKYAGPPGTGKTTTELNVVDSLLSRGVEPEDIIFTTFTRAGANEARDRACARFRLPPARFPYFRTLHSICYQALPSRSVMDNGDWYQLARIMGLYFSSMPSEREAVTRGHTRGDYLMSLWALARTSRKSLKEVYQERSLDNFPDLCLVELEHFVATVQEYKVAHNKIDFTDMLENYLVEGPDLHAEYVIADEAQDLSLLQWEVVRKLARNAKELHVAGDDDQAIHEWNGAHPVSFIDLQADEYRVLDISHRVPRLVHSCALSITDRISKRLDKAYAPRPEPGIVERLPYLGNLDLTQGTWLLLARNLAFLPAFEKTCRDSGVSYTGEAVGGIDAKTLRCVSTWNSLLAGHTATAGEAVLLYRFMSQRDRVQRGAKTKLAELPSEQRLSLNDLIKDHGLLFTGHWSKALDLLPDEDASYIAALEKAGELDKGPRIRISTIHGAKGQEADHVAILPDMTHKTFQGFQRNPDAEHRVWYVAITRARESLHIINPSTELFYPL